MIAGVTFPGNGFIYTYFTNINTLKRGDLVLCDSANRLGIATFNAYTKKSDNANAWLLQKVDKKRLRSNLVTELEESSESTKYTK